MQTAAHDHNRLTAIPSTANANVRLLSIKWIPGTDHVRCFYITSSTA